MLLDFEALKEYSKRTRPGDVITWLNDRGISWTTDGKGNPCTTLTQVDRALERKEEEFTFDGAETA